MCLPYYNSNGEIPVLSLGTSLYANNILGMYSFHFAVCNFAHVPSNFLSTPLIFF
jgi:hypothetical protein